MNDKRRDFDKEAAKWDTPPRIKLAEEVAAAVIAEAKPGPKTDVLDFGCGTGLLSLCLQPLVKSVIGADTSQGMLDVFDNKIREMGITNARTLHLDPACPVLEGSYGLVVSNMTLHHVPDIPPMLAQFHKVLVPGGKLCIADLDPDNGEFHPDKTGVFHNGFERSALSALLAGTGFTDVRQRTATTVAKPDTTGNLRHFTIFLLTATKA